MGLIGSGNRCSTRDTTDEYLRIDVGYMARKGLLRAGVTGSLSWSKNGQAFASIGYRVDGVRLVLAYKHRDCGREWESLEYPIRLERTRCNYGGWRTWFLCPASGCGRRAAFLYGGRIYACRQCRGLAYLSQRQSVCDRATERAWDLLRQLKCDDFMTIFDPDPLRPKGMHHRTFERLSERYEVTRRCALSNAPGGMRLDWF